MLANWWKYMFVFSQAAVPWALRATVLIGFNTLFLYSPHLKSLFIFLLHLYHCSPLSIQTGFQYNYTQHATTTVIRNSDVNSSPSHPRLSSAHCADQSPWQLAQNSFFSEIWPWLLEKSKKKVNSCICYTHVENTSFIWCQRACKALSSVQIWVAASFLALGKHHGPCHPPPRPFWAEGTMGLLSGDSL